VVNGLNVIGTLSASVLNLYGTSQTYNLFLGDLQLGSATLFGYGTTNVFNIKASDGSVTLKSDTAGHTFNFSNGAIWYDTQGAAPGLYAKAAGGATRIAA
jgi:hypothetical protein